MMSRYVVDSPEYGRFWIDDEILSEIKKNNPFGYQFNAMLLDDDEDEDEDGEEVQTFIRVFYHPSMKWTINLSLRKK
jgi:hypothetical protein